MYTDRLHWLTLCLNVIQQYTLEIGLPIPQT